jgi:hypothetical protein
MNYFENFPLMNYEFSGKDYLARDILRRSVFISEYRPYTDLFQTYTIKDGETPQSLAKEIYKSQYYDWVILVTNELHNPYFDWPLNQLDLERICEERYGDAIYYTRHWEINDLIVGEIKVFKDAASWVAPVYTGQAVAVSFYDYEQKLNDDKRNISILRPQLLSDFVTQFGNSINV